MSKTFLTHINLNQNELQNAVVQPLATAPSNPKLGQIYTNSNDKLLYIYNGTQWVGVGAVVSVNGKTGVVVLEKGDIGLGNVDNTSDATKKTNMTGSLASDSTGFVEGKDILAALNGKLSTSGGTMSGAIAMGTNKITGLGAPTSDTDAVTKSYVDTAISSLGAVFRFKGTKSAVSELPTAGNAQGDVWLVSADGSEYVWTKDAASGAASDWEKLGVTVDLSGYAPIDSPAFTGTPTVPTVEPGAEDNQIATVQYARDFANSLAVHNKSGIITTAMNTVDVPYSGQLINAYATMNNSIVVVDITIKSKVVTFTTATKPSSEIHCEVVYH